MKNQEKRARRANGEGTLEKKPSGIFLARWVKNGKRFSRSTGKTTEEEARKVLAQFVI